MKKLTVLIIAVGFIGCASEPTKRSVGQSAVQNSAQNSKTKVAAESTSAPGLIEIQALHGSSRAGGSLGGTMSRR